MAIKIRSSRQTPIKDEKVKNPTTNEFLIFQLEINWPLRLSSFVCVCDFIFNSVEFKKKSVSKASGAWWAWAWWMLWVWVCAMCVWHLLREIGAVWRTTERMGGGVFKNTVWVRKAMTSWPWRAWSRARLSPRLSLPDSAYCWLSPCVLFQALLILNSCFLSQIKASAQASMPSLLIFTYISAQTRSESEDLRAIH